MTGRWCGWRPTATRQRVRLRSVLSAAALAVALCGCSSNERLSLGQHDPLSAPIAGNAAAAGSAAPIGSGAAGSAEPAPAPAPGFEPLPWPRPRPPSGSPPQSPDAGQLPTEAVDAAVPQEEQPADCPAGVYEAELSCAIDPNTLPPGSQPPPDNFAMTTWLAFTVAPASDPQRLEIVEGAMMFEYVRSVFFAHLEGSLDCADGVFHAEIADGAYAPVSSQFPMSAPAPFQGELFGQLDRDASELRGSWWHGPGGNGPQCVGPWRARLQP